jgi:RimJ/RimL family protein N-acetyltransferase
MRDLHTPRLKLRSWRDTDRAPFADLNADPEVMEHFPSILTRDESDALLDRIQAHITRNEFGLWAVEIPNITGFAGVIGLAIPSFEAPFAPTVEVGWRLARKYWGHGYATEGAKVAANFAFTELSLPELVSFTVPSNLRSIAVMKRLGMRYEGVFNHPGLSPTDPRSAHVLYRLANSNLR